jgi:hypothetical protein
VDNQPSSPAAPTVSSSSQSNNCPLKTVNLTTSITSTTPVGGSVLYKTTDNPNGTDVSDPTQVGAGTYYIFYQNLTGCYSASTPVTVVVNNCPPTLTNITKSGSEDTDVTFATSDFVSNFTDVEGSSLTKIIVGSLPANGILKVNSAAVNIGDEIPFMIIRCIT